MAAKKENGRKWLTFFIICMTTGIITELPYLRWALYEPLREFLGQDNTRFGMSASLFGLLSMLLYIPGGWLADRFSHRKLFAFSSVGCGLLGFWLSTSPSFVVVMIIHALWAITNIGMFWPTMTKAISLLEEKDGQGKVFGYFEGVRGVFVIVMWLGLMQVFASLGGIGAVIITMSLLSIGCGILSWFFMPDNTEAEATSSVGILKDMGKAAKMPVTWLLAGTIFCVYSVYSASSYMQPYTQNVLGMSAVVAGYIGIIRKDVARLFTAPISGWISSRWGGRCAAIIGIFGVLFAISLAALLMLPPNGSVIVLAVVIMIVSSFAIYGMRGMYYAIIGEAGISKSIYGTVAGLAMFVGFSPDFFNPTLIGSWLDNYPGATGYRMIFIYMLCTMLVGLVFVVLLMRRNAKNADVIMQTKAENAKVK
ncbi:MAG: MFS transporter [Bacteroidia bacterium]|jgi:predicted MFS family arabinose efflux permease|nr:MFS transporter [Bacteroidia bacterium]